MKQLSGPGNGHHHVILQNKDFFIALQLISVCPSPEPRHVQLYIPSIAVISSSLLVTALQKLLVGYDGVGTLFALPQSPSIILAPPVQTGSAASCAGVTYDTVRTPHAPTPAGSCVCQYCSYHPIPSVLTRVASVTLLDGKPIQLS